MEVVLVIILGINTSLLMFIILKMYPLLKGIVEAIYIDYQIEIKE